MAKAKNPKILRRARMKSMIKTTGNVSIEVREKVKIMAMGEKISIANKIRRSQRRGSSRPRNKRNGIVMQSARPMPLLPLKREPPSGPRTDPAPGLPLVKIQEGEKSEQQYLEKFEP